VPPYEKVEFESIGLCSIGLPTELTNRLYFFGPIASVVRNGGFLAVRRTEIAVVRGNKKKTLAGFALLSMESFCQLPCSLLLLFGCVVCQIPSVCEYLSGII
jgi:hypothetical protein